jgi:frataxin-like iron-binding protein CyaY
MLALVEAVAVVIQAAMEAVVEAVDIQVDTQVDMVMVINRTIKSTTLVIWNDYAREEISVYAANPILLER